MVLGWVESGGHNSLAISNGKPMLAGYDQIGVFAIGAPHSLKSGYWIEFEYAKEKRRFPFGTRLQITSARRVPIPQTIPAIYRRSMRREMIVAIISGALLLGSVLFSISSWIVGAALASMLVCFVGLASDEMNRHRMYNAVSEYAKSLL